MRRTGQRATSAWPATAGQRRVEHVMGMPVTLDIRNRLATATLNRLAEQVFGWLRTVDALFSPYRADSQVTLLDQGLIRPGEADPLVREVLAHSARLNERTEGYFDIHSTGRLDPSGYVKGWALQRASALLVEEGATDHFLRAGGDVHAAGRPEPGRTWRVSVRDPFQPDTMAWIVHATDLAVATSEGRARHLTATRGGGIYDPLARRPASGLASVTITGPDLGSADAYATAAHAMGPAAHDWLAGLDDYAYAVIDEQGRRVTDRAFGLMVADGTQPKISG